MALVPVGVRPFILQLAFRESLTLLPLLRCPQGLEPGKQSFWTQSANVIFPRSIFPMSTPSMAVISWLATGIFGVETPAASCRFHGANLRSFSGKKASHS